jgi:hypothetical protein
LIQASASSREGNGPTAFTGSGFGWPVKITTLYVSIGIENLLRGSTKCAPQIFPPPAVAGRLLDHPSALSVRRGSGAVGDLALAHEAAIDEHGQVVVGTDDRFHLANTKKRVIALATMR